MLSRTLLTSVSLTAALAATTAQADIVQLDDVIIDGSLCVGQDCVNGESFGFDTIRLKENNLRIKFQDTSTSASFPSNDWQLTANDSSNGGANKFSIDDITGARTPFTVEAAARTNALYVEADGDVGFGTANPVVNLHAVDGNTPTLRLEQDGTSGFTPQTYDIAANEANFFIRDVTNGSRLFFRAKPGAPADSLYIAADGDVGLGTDNPSASLHVDRVSADANLLLEDTDGRTQIWMEEATNSTSVMKMELASDTFNISFDGTGASELQVQRDGDVRVIRGDLEVLAGSVVVGGTTLNVPDYVFAPDYELMPLDEVAVFIAENSHLPNIPSAAEVNAGSLNMTAMQMALLEKVEELTLYTLEQHQHISHQNDTISALEKRLELLERVDAE